MSGSARGAKSTATTSKPEGPASISEVAADLEVPQHVIKFWETQFTGLTPHRTASGRRYYGPEEVNFLRAVRSLVFDKGYTIKGVQRLIRQGAIKSEGKPLTLGHGKARISKEAKETLAALMSPEPTLRMALVEQIRHGFQFELVEELAKLTGVKLSELVDLGVIPRRTLAHSRRNQQFSPAQSDRATRFFRLFQRAKDTFGSDEKAMSWLKRPTKPLQQNAPMDLLDTEEGARVVEDLLTRIDYGIAA